MMDQKLNRKLETLNKIGIALSNETDLNRLLELILKEARAFAQADAGSLYLVDQKKNCLQFEIAQNDTLRKRFDLKANTFKLFSLPLTKKSIAGYVAITGSTLNIRDAYKLPGKVDFEFNRDFDKRNNYRTKSMLIVPMKDTGGKIIGVLQLINSTDNQKSVISFDVNIESLVSSLASQAAVAIKNAQLLMQVKAVFDALIRYSVSAIDARSPFTAGHSMRVAKLSLGLAKAVNETHKGPYLNTHFSTDQLEELNYAAWLHDIGKIGVSENILDKRTRLSDEKIETIYNRFQNIKASAIIQNIRHKLSLAQKHEQMETTAINKSDYEAKQLISQIDDDLAFIKSINQSFFIDESGIKRLKKIKGKRFLDIDDNEQNYLTDFEFENLSIPSGNLTGNERDQIQLHVTHTENIVNNIPFTGILKKVPSIAAGHHEMLDGSGYPRNKKADSISIETRIMTIADIFEALTAKDRPYKKSIDIDKSLSILQEEAYIGRLDKELVKIFIDEKVYETG